MRRHCKGDHAGADPEQVQLFKTSRKGLVAMIEYPVLEAATGKFSESNVLGVGGFGCVYKAVFDGGVTAAVKRLESGGPECERNSR